MKILGLRTATPLVTAMYIEFKYKAKPYLHLCTCNPLTPRELIYPAMGRYNKVVYSFCE